jgi:threonine synthase
MDLSMSTGSLLTRLTCRGCSASFDADRPQTVCPTCGSALLAEYDLSRLEGHAWLASLPGRPTTLWRYRELLPVRDEKWISSLGEGCSPVLPLGEVPEAPGLEVWVKDEGALPTGSFKARGMAVAVSRASELGLTELFVPSAGNAAVALSAYGARARRKVRVYLPEATPEAMPEACRLYGAEVVRVPGTIRDAGIAARQREEGTGAFDVSTLREPYRVEGKKTMGWEILEQFRGDRMPDAVVYPAGGGTGLVGMARAFSEMRELGLLERPPRLYAVQPEGCAPLVRALQEGKPRIEPWAEPRTVAPGLLVPAPFASERVLETVRETKGDGVPVSDEEIRRAMGQLGRRHGVSASPEGAAPYAALSRLLSGGRLHPGERVLLFNTGTGIPFLGSGLAR